MHNFSQNPLENWLQVIKDSGAQFFLQLDHNFSLFTVRKDSQKSSRNLSTLQFQKLQPACIWIMMMQAFWQLQKYNFTTWFKSFCWASGARPKAEWSSEFPFVSKYAWLLPNFLHFIHFLNHAMLRSRSACSISRLKYFFLLLI